MICWREGEDISKHKKGDSGKDDKEAINMGGMGETGGPDGLPH